MANSLEISSCERSLLDLLRGEPPLSVEQLTQRLGVTATAVRQRLGRLMALELVERLEERQERGRPLFRYQLTEKGRHSGGSNLDDLAWAMWEELQQLDSEDRRRVLVGVIRRLADRYSGQITGGSLTERVQAIAELLAERQVPAVVQSEQGQLLLQVVGCPYPRLADAEHEICQMETELFSRLAGQPLRLERCQADGNRCCTFTTDNPTKQT